VEKGKEAEFEKYIKDFKKDFPGLFKKDSE
jgi:hypothetical protein